MKARMPCIAAVGACVFLSCGCASVNRDLAARWRADGNGEDAENGHHAVLRSVDFAQGARGQAFVVTTPESRISVADSPTLNFGPNEDFSVTACVKPERAETSFGVMDIVDKRLTKDMLGAVGYALCLSEGRLSCQLAAAPYRQLAFSPYTSLAPDLRDGKSHHVVMTVRRNLAKGPPVGGLYVDGQRVLTFDPSLQSGDLTTTEPLLIGTHPDPAMNAGFKGEIDEVRVYRRVLADSEIRKLSKWSLGSE